MKNLIERTVQKITESKRSTIAAHARKRRDLEKKASDTLLAHHTAVKELDRHNKNHPDYEARKAKINDTNGTDWANYKEPGRSGDRALQTY